MQIRLPLLWAAAAAGCCGVPLLLQAAAGCRCCRLSLLRAAAAAVCRCCCGLPLLLRSAAAAVDCRCCCCCCGLPLLLWAAAAAGASPAWRSFGKVWRALESMDVAQAPASRPATGENQLNLSETFAQVWIGVIMIIIFLSQRVT